MNYKELALKERIKGFKLSKDKADEALLTLALIGLAMACVSHYLYFSGSETINKNSITTVNNCIVSEPVRYVYVSRGTGKRKTTMSYYVYKLEGYSQTFLFLNKYYCYALSGRVPGVKVGDTVSIQLFKHTLEAFHDRESGENMEIVNLGINGKFIIDYDYTNKRIADQNREFMYISLAVFVGFTLILLFKQYNHYLKFCEQIKKQ